jgi:hypothetical protein
LCHVFIEEGRNYRRGVGRVRLSLSRIHRQEQVRRSGCDDVRALLDAFRAEITYLFSRLEKSSMMLLGDRLVLHRID